ncbi:BgTH12-06275 [Blumeria graminis f. sp. triticale]|uniref:BgTH12-06275 n=1 Tax=Blumeria graminis f. sp. triticale TaxID=1689686 RepID=A0A9W4D3D7_BLUGR|nr:BgTH12-06275 [Blumeria graminis f. sp. triticale]
MENLASDHTKISSSPTENDSNSVAEWDPRDSSPLSPDDKFDANLGAIGCEREAARRKSAPVLSAKNSSLNPIWTWDKFTITT